MIKCALCGCSYEPVRGHCAGCPLSRGCGKACCPNCGYSPPPESSLLKWWRGTFSSKKTNKGSQDHVR